MLRGLAFDSLPAHVIGTGTDSTGRTVDLQRLGNTLAGRYEDVIMERAAGSTTWGTPRPADSRPAGYMGPWIEPAAPAMQAEAPADNTDPFVMLGQLRDTEMQQVTPLFDRQEEAFKLQIGKIKGDLFKQYNIEFEGLQGLGLDRDQLRTRDQQLRTKYKMAYAKATSEIEPAMQELSLERQKAIAKVEAAHAERSLRISQVQALADKGLIDPVAAKQEQLGIMGYSVPISTLRPPTTAEQMQELDALTKSVQDTALRVKEEQGRVYEDVGVGSEAEWVRVDDPARIAELRSAKQMYDRTRAAKQELALQEGRKRGLLDVGSTAASPIAAAVKTARPAPSPSQMRGMGAFGAGAASAAYGLNSYDATAPDISPYLAKARNKGATPDDLVKLTAILRSGDQQRIQTALSRLE